MKLTVLAGCFLLIFGLSACSSVKPYQRAYLNDNQMRSDDLEIHSFENNVFTYREGSIISGTSKGKGGCGCN